jgi:hypothetical protein
MTDTTFDRHRVNRLTSLFLNGACWRNVIRENVFLPKGAALLRNCFTRFGKKSLEILFEFYDHQMLTLGFKNDKKESVGELIELDREMRYKKKRKREK